jgi:hypothetical protein
MQQIAPATKANTKCSKALKPQQKQRGQACEETGCQDADIMEIGSKGPIAMLQEFVQCSRSFPLPPNYSALQWSYERRMATKAALEYRATVAFFLEGVPHHTAGTWQASKLRAKRDTAHRALSFFVGRWSEELLQYQPDSDTSFQGPGEKDANSEWCSYEERLLECFCAQLPSCTGRLEWSLETNSEGECFGVVEVPLLDVPHKLAGAPKDDEREAFADVARRALWYLQCPGFEEAFQAERLAPSNTPQELETPSTTWLPNDSTEDALEEAERKTVVMRAQNRLQQVFAGQLQAREGVWEWSYEADPKDSEWPPLFRASVKIPVLGREFAGNWARGQRDAQIGAIACLNIFLDDIVNEK